MRTILPMISNLCKLSSNTMSVYYETVIVNWSLSLGCILLYSFIQRVTCILCEAIPNANLTFFTVYSKHVWCKRHYLQRHRHMTRARSDHQGYHRHVKGHTSHQVGFKQTVSATCSYDDDDVIFRCRRIVRVAHSEAAFLEQRGKYFRR
ncbi:hypothetical protein DMN91_005585 [Ooceraea biroi]|uniref:Uncharacterized protein n=1 Tax=Ooceraea biroi TaxID=2015173 RepID=A0A3L8DLZ8_OOCBI|nr:hypothetical protein DMN91_005585 [Ooceraea biroi]